MMRRLIHCLTTVTFLLASTGAILFFLFFYYGRGLPDYEYLHHYEPPTLSQITDAKGKVLYEFSQERRIYVSIDKIPSLVVNSFLVAEDKNFYYHCGLDINGILRAALTNSASGSWATRPLGGSSITQQVAKNFLIGNERSFERKVKEAIMALRLESTFSKRRILELYLNQIYLGMGAYGVAAAAQTYFNKTLDQLSIEEIAFLAAMPKAPSFYPNQKDLIRGKIRRDWVIDRLCEEGFLTESKAAVAKATPLKIIQGAKNTKAQLDYHTEQVRLELINQLGEDVVAQGGLAVRTTYDSVLQKIAQKALRQGLIAYDRRHGWRGPLDRLQLAGTSGFPLDWKTALMKKPAPPGLGNWLLAVVLEVTPEQAGIGLKDGKQGIIPLTHLAWARKNLPRQELGPRIKSPKQVLAVGDVIPVSRDIDDRYHLEQIPNVEGGLVALDPRNGRVLAMVGGYDFERRQFNCATQANRQPGSSFKPWVYLTALENGYTPQTRVLDAPVIVNVGGKMGVYAPKNINHRYYGPTPLQSGLIYSRNVMTVRLAQQIGLRRIEKTVVKFGIVDKLPHQLAMALGAGETTLLKMTTAYGMIANGGYPITPIFIDHVWDRHNTIVYQSPILRQASMPIAKPKALRQLRRMMEGVVKKGTGRRLLSLERPIAGKTGSTNDYKDAWFIGFTPDLVVGIFVGFPTPYTLGNHETGKNVAVPIFEAFMGEAMEGKPVLTFDGKEADL